MTYDSTTQAQPVMLDGTELKIGDEVIVARKPENPANDDLWNYLMVPCFARPASVVEVSIQSGDMTQYRQPLVRARVVLESGETQSWWFRLSELERVRTHHHRPRAEPDTPTEFPNLVRTNETTGPGMLHPACCTTRTTPYNTAFLVNEQRLCHYELSLRPGYAAYLTQQEAEQAQKARRERFIEWRDDRAYKRNQFLRQIRAKLTTHPFANTKKGSINWRQCSVFDRSYYTNSFKQQNHAGRTAAKIVGKLVGHFHSSPNKQRPLPDDDVFALLRYTLTGSLPFAAKDALDARTDQAGAAYRAYAASRRKITHTGEWQRVPWDLQAWFARNEAAGDRLPHISVVNPQEVAYYQSVDKLIRGIETRTKPGRFLAKFFPSLTPDEVRQYANDYLVATAPKQLHFARTEDEIITAIDEGPSESCQTRGYYDKSPDESPWYAGHIHPAACYASGDFEVAYITDNNKPASIVDLHADAQRITARAICNAKDKTVARIYGDAAKMLPLLTSAGYTQVERALVGCRLLKIENEEGSGWIMPYVDAGIGSGGGSLDVDDYYDSGKSYWLLVRPDAGDYCTYEGYDKRGVLDAEEERHRCPRCNALHDDEDDIHYSDYEETHHCSECDGDFVSAVTSRTRYGGDNYDMVLIDNAIQIDGEWYANDDNLLTRCGFVQCIHCDEWTSLDNTTTTDSGLVCSNCDDELVELAEESPDGNEYGYLPDCTQYVNTETGETVWLDDNTDVDNFTTEDDAPKYVSLDVWREMQQRQESFEFVGPPKHNPVAIVTHLATRFDPIPWQSEPVFDDLRI
jgi:hypothetical protein